MTRKANRAARRAEAAPGAADAVAAEMRRAVLKFPAGAPIKQNVMVKTPNAPGAAVHAGAAPHNATAPADDAAARLGAALARLESARQETLRAARHAQEDAALDDAFACEVCAWIARYYPPTRRWRSCPVRPGRRKRF